MIALVRHAAAGRRRRLDDDARPLTRRGLAQAADLVWRLRAVPLKAVLSSPCQRCRQTVEPMAAARGLTVTDEPLLGTGASAAALLPLLLQLAEGGAALCSHGEVISRVVAELVEDGVIRRSEARFEKGSTWLLEASGGRISLARYLPPDRAWKASARATRGA